MNPVVFLPTSVTTAQYTSWKVTQNYKGTNHLSKRNFKHFSGRVFFCLYYSVIGFTMVIPEPDLAFEFLKTAYNSITGKHAPFKKFKGQKQEQALVLFRNC